MISMFKSISCNRKQRAASFVNTEQPVAIARWVVDAFVRAGSTVPISRKEPMTSRLCRLTTTGARNRQ